jgi:hypothetical protein
MASVLGLSSAGASVIGKRAARRFLSSLARRYFCYVVSHHSRSAPRRAFELTWSILSSSSLFLLVLKEGWFSSRHSCVRTELMGLYFRHAPHLYGTAKTIMSRELLDTLSGQESVILVDFHQSHIGVTKALCDHGLDHCRIAANVHGTKSHLAAIGLDVSKVHLIERSISSLAKLREAARAGKTVCCSVDFKRDSQYVLISPTMFDFARHLGLSVIFLKTVVDVDGNIHLHSSVIQNVVDSEKSVVDMLEFFNSVPGDKKLAEIQKFEAR